MSVGDHIMLYLSDIAFIFFPLCVCVCVHIVAGLCSRIWLLSTVNLPSLLSFCQPTQTQPKNGDGPQRGAGNTLNKGKGPANGCSCVKKTGPWPPQRP